MYYYYYKKNNYNIQYYLSGGRLTYASECLCPGNSDNDFRLLYFISILYNIIIGTAGRHQAHKNRLNRRRNNTMTIYPSMGVGQRNNMTYVSSYA